LPVAAIAGPPQKEKGMADDTYQMGKDMAQLQAEVARIAGRLREIADNAQKATEHAQEYIVTMLTETGIIEIDDDGGYGLGDAFKKAEG